MSENKEIKTDGDSLLTYKGKPFVRKGNDICFGDAKSDKYVLTLTIKDSKQENGVEIATSVLILIQSTDPESREIVKFGEKNSLYEAFEMGEIWLDSLLKQAN